MKCPRLARFCILFAALIATSKPVAGQIYQELYAFRAGIDGYGPEGALVQGADGNFYGTTAYGGQPTNCAACGYGTVFKMTPDGLLTTIAWFNGNNNSEYPLGSLLQAEDRNFYGATSGGPMFRVTADGVLTTLPVGGGDLGDLTQGTNGYLYGTDAYSGDVFWTSLNGHTVGGVYTPGPSGGLIQASDGNFYGLTSAGGAYYYGTAYRLTPTGVLTTLASFGHNPREDYPVYPYDPLMQASDGNLYGVASGGYYQEGAVFKLTLNGSISTFASFNVTNGFSPNGRLIEANDGNFYGTAPYGGSLANDHGVVFRITPQGQITAVVSFTGSGGTFPGAEPMAGLVQGSDGNLYGTTAYGGSRGQGNVFRIIMPGPTLTLNSQPSTLNQLTLSWRTNYPGFTLQSSPSLNPPAWVDCTNPVAVSNGQYIITNAMSSGAQFFRLRK
jgi:uncharacterized repeat protein (TIGR03803 family)